MEHRAFASAFGVLAVALVCLLALNPPPPTPSGTQERDGGLDKAHRRGRSVRSAQDAEDGTADCAQAQFLRRRLRRDLITPGTVTTLRREHLEHDGNGNASAHGGRDACTRGSSASCRDAQAEAQTGRARATGAAVLVAVALVAALRQWPNGRPLGEENISKNASSQSPTKRGLITPKLLELFAA